MFSSENKGEDSDVITLKGPDGRAIKISKSELIKSLFGEDGCSNCQNGCCHEDHQDNNSSKPKEYVYYANIADSHPSEDSCGCGCGGGCGCRGENDGECCGGNGEGCMCGGDGGCCHNH